MDGLVGWGRVPRHCTVYTAEHGNEKKTTACLAAYQLQSKTKQKRQLLHMIYIICIPDIPIIPSTMYMFVWQLTEQTESRVRNLG